MKIERYSDFEDAEIIKLRSLSLSNEGIARAISRMFKTRRTKNGIVRRVRKLGLPPKPVVTGGIRMHVAVDKTLHEAVGREAVRLGVSKSELTRMALIAYVTELGQRQ